MSRNNLRRVPAIVEDEILASRMEEALTRPDPRQRVVESMRRSAKAGTYTLAEKYRLTLEGFKKHKE